MEEEGMEAVLAKAIYLRVKISNCMNRATNKKYDRAIEGFEGGAVADGDKKEKTDGPSPSEAEEEEDEEAERLFHIQGALESLEHQLSNLQALQQQQRYQKEVALSEIEHGRRMLLDKLKEYKGHDLEVIQEASAFLDETVDHNSGLFLPPNPIRPQKSVRDNQYVSHFSSARKIVSDGVITSEAMKELNDPEINQPQTIPKSHSKGLGHIIGATAKTVFTVVSVMSMLSLSGFGCNICRNRTSFKILRQFQQPSAEKREQTVQCPPGRALVLENGESRCVVKERVAIPFELAVAKPDVNYGYG